MKHLEVRGGVMGNGNAAVSIQRKAKRAFEFGLAIKTKQNPKSHYEYFQSKGSFQNGVETLELEDGRAVCEDEQSKADPHQFVIHRCTYEGSRTTSGDWYCRKRNVIPQYRNR